MILIFITRVASLNSPESSCSRTEQSYLTRSSELESESQLDQIRADIFERRAAFNFLTKSWR